MEEYKEKMLEEIIKDLSDNFADDKDVLSILLNEVITNALSISNRKESEKNIKLLAYEIKECVKTAYLQRGVEEVVSLNESGRNSTFKDPIEKMRNNIIKNGKRVLF